MTWRDLLRSPDPSPDFHSWFHRSANEIADRHQVRLAPNLTEHPTSCPCDGCEMAREFAELGREAERRAGQEGRDQAVQDYAPPPPKVVYKPSWALRRLAKKWPEPMDWLIWLPPEERTWYLRGAPFQEMRRRYPEVPTWAWKLLTN